MSKEQAATAKAEKVNRLDKVLEILRAGPLSYQDIVAKLGGDIALLPAVNATPPTMIRQKVGGHFLYGLPGARFPDPPPAPVKAPAKAAGATPAKAGAPAQASSQKR